MSGDMMRAAAKVYEQVAATLLGQEAPEERDTSRNGKEVVRLLAETMRG